jgi:hypothetical protein
MPVRELTKDVTIGENKYRISKMNVFDASWVVTQLLTKILPSAMSARMEGTLGTLPKGSVELSRQDLFALQNLALDSVARYEPTTNLPIPILGGPGKLSFKDLETDVTAVLSLTVDSISFSVSSFFEEEGLEKVMSLLSTAPTSSPTRP